MAELFSLVKYYFIYPDKWVFPVVNPKNAWFTMEKIHELNMDDFGGNFWGKPCGSSG